MFSTMLRSTALAVALFAPMVAYASDVHSTHCESTLGVIKGNSDRFYQAFWSPEQHAFMVVTSSKISVYEVKEERSVGPFTEVRGVTPSNLNFVAQVLPKGYEQIPNKVDGHLATETIDFISKGGKHYTDECSPID